MQQRKMGRGKSPFKKVDAEQSSSAITILSDLSSPTTWIFFKKNEGREERKNKREGCVILKEILGRRARISSDKGKGGEGGRESYIWRMGGGA